MTAALISPADLQSKIGSNITIIDTRDRESYAAGHIAGAVNLHDIFTYLSTSTPDGMKELTDKFAAIFADAGLDGTRTAVIYEQSMDTGFGQSCRGYFLLKYLGYPLVEVLHGGLSAWESAGLPLTSEVPNLDPAGFAADPEAAEIMLTTDDVRAALGDERIALLDVRDVDEWIGESSSPYGKDFCPRKGRIPGARWLEWYRMMKPTADGVIFKSRNEILAECATVGIDRDMSVYLYCFKGARASNTYLALKEAGFEDVRVYFGSWNEWSRDPELPIEEGFPFKT
ncbi:sulfurtransferase [Algihabitans albus]|uniref:sulfurtransferase n=1 Tax=Algihabitans albus TaxID=2164067 RepID=UPI000E5C9020|nr:sulfurtransferase [Algihabitans albus]